MKIHIPSSEELAEQYALDLAQGFRPSPDEYLAPSMKEIESFNHAADSSIPVGYTIRKVQIGNGNPFFRVETSPHEYISWSTYEECVDAAKAHKVQGFFLSLHDEE